MVYLGDYLGQILSEITIARVQADLESVRIAELYANHDLLKHFPVPRVRLGDVDLDIPIIIIEADEPPDKERPRGGLSVSAMLRHFQSLTSQQLELSSIDLNKKTRTELDQQLEERSRKMGRPEYVNVDTNRTANQFTTTVRRFLQQREIEPEAIRSFTESLNIAARRDFISARSAHPRILVGATSSQIQEAADESVTRITIRITEQSMEWTRITAESDDDDDNSERLVPE